MINSKSNFLEFFAGGGMVRSGLGSGWKCSFANDLDTMKVATYVANFGKKEMLHRDVALLSIDDLPDVKADLSWASFPCQDLSLAGNYKGLGSARVALRTRSGMFWPFWDLMLGLAEVGRAPRIIVLENVCGIITSRNGKDFSAISNSLAKAGYKFGACVINAELFVPQSRPRVFFIAVHSHENIPSSFVGAGPQDSLHPRSLVSAYEKILSENKSRWIWWKIKNPPVRNTSLGDLIEENPTGIEWHSASETKYIISLMSDTNYAKLKEAKKAGRRIVGSIYRRTRFDEKGNRIQRAEVRFDDVAGCLRTPSGGSSRQTIIVVDGNKIRTRLLSVREAARLMSLPDDYKLPDRYNDAYKVCGDGVCSAVVSYLAQSIIEPILCSSKSKILRAAE